jgi:hypothetical protein
MVHNPSNVEKHDEHALGRATTLPRLLRYWGYWATEPAWFWITHHAHMNSFQTAGLCAASFDAHLNFKQVHSVSEISELHFLNLFI